MLMTSDCPPHPNLMMSDCHPPSSGELAAARLAWALAALDSRHEPEVLRMALALLPMVSSAPRRQCMQLLMTSDCPPHQVSSAPRRASEAANACSSVWFAVVPRAQPSHVASLVHQYHIWATSEARRKELGLGSSLASKVASDFH